MQFTGIRFRLLLLGIVPAFLLALALAYYFISYQFDSLERSLKERGDIITRQLATASTYGVFSGNIQILQELADTLSKEKDVSSVVIRNVQGAILAESKKNGPNQTEYLMGFEAPVILAPLEDSADSEIELFYPPEQEFPEKRIGRVQVKLSMESTIETQHMVLYNSLMITVSVLFVAAILATRLGHVISSPIIKLTNAVNAISEGNMSTRAYFPAEGELEDLREGFNVMAIALQQTHQYLAKQVENATAQYRIAMKALKDKNIELGKIGELAVAQNEIKSQFLAHISHEIRTPMNGIIGFADLLTKSPLSVQQYEQTQLIKNSALNLLSIVNEILDFSSLEAGSFSLNHKFSSIRTCLEETACLFNSYANQSKIILDIDNDIPSRVYIDPVRLQQVATNLLGNAVKFAEKGKIVVRCHLLKTGAPKPWILITVSDNGPGVSKRNEVRLFSPFLLLSDYAINHESGTGLGLHISKNIVERLNGKMGVKTLENIGSTFWFAFPVIDQQTVPISTNHQNLILICPDPLNRSAFKKQLGNLGFSVYCYDSLSSYLEKKPLTINLVFFHSLTHNENVSSIYKTYSVIKSTTQAPVVYLYQQKQLPNINPVIPTLQLPCRSKYLSTFIDSVIKKGEIQPIEQKHAPQIIASSPDFTILLADDNEINRILLKSQIEPFSRNISIANDGREALKLLMDRKYDLIFLDLQMPKISGMELIKKIKKADCINFATPVLAITAHAQKEQRDAVIKAGFDECLIKPVLADQISEAIERLLKIVSGNPNRSRYEPSDEDYVQGMLEKTQNNKQLAKTLFEKLFQELPEQIKTIKSALALGNTVLAKETTHKLHGSVSFCGLARLQQKAEKMENSFLSGNIRQIQPFFDALEKEVNQFLNQRSEISDTFSDV